MDGKSKIAEASIEITAVVGEAKSEINNLKTDVEQVGVAADITGGQMDSAFSRASSAIGKTTSKASKFVGTLTSTVGIATGVIGAIAGIVAVYSLLTSTIKSTIKATKDYEKTVTDIAESTGKKLKDELFNATDASEISKEIKKIQEEEALGQARIIEAYEKKITLTRSLGFVFQHTLPSVGFERLREETKKDLEFSQKVSDTRQNLARREDEKKKSLKENEIRITAEKEKQAKLDQEELQRLARREAGLKAIADQAESLRIELLPDDEKTTANAERQVRLLKDLAKQAGIDIQHELVQASIRSIEETLERTKKAKRDAAAEETRLDNERAEKQHQRDVELDAKRVDLYERKMIQVTERLANNLNGSFGTGFTTMLQTISSDVQDAVAMLRRNT